MLKDLKHHLDDEYVQELLSYSIFPDPDEFDQVVERYHREPDLLLYGLEDEGDLVGIIGYSIDQAGTLTVHHLAVHPECRGVGFGRGLILEAIAKESPQEVQAETDEEAVDFYRNIGFQVESIGEIYPGVERYRCTFRVTE